MPVIGIPVRYDFSKDEHKSILYIFESVRRCIQKAGGEVYLIVPIQDVDYMKVKNIEFDAFTEEEIKKINNTLDKCDGLFLPGGIKFTPFDRYILEYAIKKDIPTLGVCLSMQMMSCYEEEVELQKIESDINHQQVEEDYVHTVKIDKDSKLYKIVGKEEFLVNSNHIYQAGENHIYKTVAKSPDGVIEGIEHPTATFNIGIQWHPEKTYNIDANSKLIIDAFIAEATKYSENKGNSNLC